MENTQPVLYITVNGIDPKQILKLPDPLKLIQEFMGADRLSTEELQKTLAANVRAGSDIKIINLLLDQGADINFTYSGGEKLLHIAFSSGSDALFNHLINKGAKLNKREQEFFYEINKPFVNKYISTIQQFADFTNKPQGPKSTNLEM